MKSSGFLHEAVKGPFSICKHIFSIFYIFWGRKRLYSKHTEAEQKIHHAYTKRMYFVTKRSLNNTPYGKFSLTKFSLNIPKQEKNMFILNVFLIRFLPYRYTARICLSLTTSGVQKQPFADVLWNRCSWKFCRIHRKTPMLESLFNKVTPVLSYDLCEIFKKTYFLITSQNQTTLLRKQIRKAHNVESHTCDYYQGASGSKFWR